MSIIIILFLRNCFLFIICYHYAEKAKNGATKHVISEELVSKRRNRVYSQNETREICDTFSRRELCYTEVTQIFGVFQ